MAEGKGRKRLIQPGSVFPAGEVDVFQSVLNSYSEKTGQPKVFEDASETASQPDDKLTSQQGSKTTGTTETDDDDRLSASQPDDKTAGQQVNETSSQQDSSAAVQQDDTPAGKPVNKSARQQADKSAKPQSKAIQEAEGPKRLCSYRIPGELDDWLEDYAHAHRKEGVKKQDLVAEAIRLLRRAKEGKKAS